MDTYPPQRYQLYIRFVATTYTLQVIVKLSSIMYVPNLNPQTAAHLGIILPISLLNGRRMSLEVASARKIRRFSKRPY